jgi:MFS family permease
MLLFVIVQALLAFRVALPEPVLWAAYGALGGTGILTYAVLAEYFPSTLIGRANTTFTLVIFVGIFVAQNAIGAALGHWPATNGHYPVEAHQTVWSCLIAIQLIAAVWYFMPDRALRVARARKAARAAERREDEELVALARERMNEPSVRVNPDDL